MIGRFFRAKPPLPFLVIRRRPRIQVDLVVRKYCAEDFSACIQLYKENESGKFPPNSLDDFAAYLETEKFLILVVERQGETVATGGIYSGSQKDAFYYGLTFGLVAPCYHRSGIGIALLLSRIAMLPEPASWWPVIMTCVQQSRSFYEQFGFRCVATNPDDHPLIAGHFMAVVEPKQIQLSQKYLRKHGIITQVGDARIPFNPSLIPPTPAPPPPLPRR